MVRVPCGAGQARKPSQRKAAPSLGLQTRAGLGQDGQWAPESLQSRGVGRSWAYRRAEPSGPWFGLLRGTPSLSPDD